MDKHACRLCNRRFTNGRALGGHMRAHVAAMKRARQDSSTSSVVLPDGESETESSRAPVRRSRRRLRAPDQYEAEPGTASSVSDTTAEEDVARCLMMLSRDVWTSEAQKIHQCSFCSRIFKSGQALGGHKRSHLMQSTASAVAETENEVTRSGGKVIIDLNEPPEEGELSAVSCTHR